MLLERPWHAVLLLSLAIGCASARYAPLTRYSPLKCRDLEVSYRQLPPARERRVASVLDPTLGWEGELGERCDPNAAPSSHGCRILSALAVSQERPLRSLNVEQAFRASYRHSLGATVIVRAFRVNGQAHLVAKVLEHTYGPLSWTTGRRLSDGEWSSLQNAAASLPKGRDSYHSDSVPKYRTAAGSRCYRNDAAELRVERLDRDALDILDVAYSPRSCSGACCDPEAEPTSRFFLHLVELVGCERGPEGSKG